MEINSGNYVENVRRTEPRDYTQVKERLQDEDTIKLLHAALGLVTEAAEVADVLKKHIFYGKPIDSVNLKEEVGDGMWYAGIAIDVLRTTMDDVLSCNIEKLRKRYPDKFNVHDALHRDKENEMSHFKTGTNEEKIND
jgi:NTP pyrophosphatase (non-canonical NTP hydrolase)